MEDTLTEMIHDTKLLCLAYKPWKMYCFTAASLQHLALLAHKNLGYVTDSLIAWVMSQELIHTQMWLHH